MKNILFLLILIFSFSSYPLYNSITHQKNLENPIIKNYEHTPYEMYVLLIKSHEKLHLDSYKDISRYSIGWGTISYEGEKITKQEADQRFNEFIESDLSYKLKEVEHLRYEEPVVYAVLADFAYNTGSLSDKIIKYALQHNWKSLVKEIDKYVWAGGKKLKGLKKRRKNCNYLIENKDNINLINNYFNKIKR